MPLTNGSGFGSGSLTLLPANGPGIIGLPASGGNASHLAADWSCLSGSAGWLVLSYCRFGPLDSRNIHLSSDWSIFNGSIF